MGDILCHERVIFMGMRKFHTAGCTAALKCAAATLWAYGWEYDASAKVLLLPVPSFDPDGMIKGGGRLEDILTPDTVVIGGNLHADTLAPCRCIDLLNDPQYVAENAAITAHCALKYILSNLPATVYDSTFLIVGWGRIGKCLAKLLRSMGGAVTVYARKDADRAMLTALGYDTLPSLDTDLSGYEVVVNTAPVMLLPKGRLTCRQLKIDLASKPGIEGDDVIWARFLPGKDAPESSGKLIARTVDRLGKEFLL